MPASTARLALPYPLPADTVDVPRDVQALATKLDGISGITPAIVATLPGAPVEGQECVWSPVISRKNGALLFADPYWRMRYFSGRWRYLGGTPFIASVPGPFSFTGLGGAFLTLKTRISIPSVGDWAVRAQATVTGVNAGTNMQLNLTIAVTDNAGAASQWAAVSSAPVGSTSTSGSMAGHGTWRIASLTSPNFETFLDCYGYTVSGSVSYGTLYLEPIVI